MDNNAYDAFCSGYKAEEHINHDLEKNGFKVSDTMEPMTYSRQVPYDGLVRPTTMDTVAVMPDSTKIWISSKSQRTAGSVDEKLICEALTAERVPHVNPLLLVLGGPWYNPLYKYYWKGKWQKKTPAVVARVSSSLDYLDTKTEKGVFYWCFYNDFQNKLMELLNEFNQG